MKRVVKKPDERRQEIIKAAMELFRERGYKDTTIQHIAEHGGIAQGLCYRYFASKRELYAAAIDWYSQESIEAMRDAAQKYDSVIERFNVILYSLIERALLDDGFESRHLEERQIRLEHIQKMAVHLADMLIPLVQQGIKERLFRCTNAQSAVRLLCFGIMHLVHHEIPPQDTGKHIASFIPFIKESCERILGASQRCGIGKGWEKLG